MKLPPGLASPGISVEFHGGLDVKPTLIHPQYVHVSAATNAH